MSRDLRAAILHVAIVGRTTIAKSLNKRERPAGFVTASLVITFSSSQITFRSSIREMDVYVVDEDRRSKIRLRSTDNTRDSISITFSESEDVQPADEIGRRDNFIRDKIIRRQTTTTTMTTTGKSHFRPVGWNETKPLRGTSFPS